MHPIERLRYVARASGSPALVAREAAEALADVVSGDPAGLVTGCRRLIDRHVTSGPVWWLSARMLSAAEPAAAACEAAAELDEDPTADVLSVEIPEDTTVLVVGWPDVTAVALRRRGDVEVLVVDAGGEGSALARRLADAGNAAVCVSDSGVAPATVVAGLVLVEAFAAGPSGILAAPGSHAAAAVAAASGLPVWAVAGVGRLLPAQLWDVLLQRFDESGLEPWERDCELVPAGLLTAVVGPAGRGEVEPSLRSATCPAVAELLRSAG